MRSKDDEENLFNRQFGHKIKEIKKILKPRIGYKITHPEIAEMLNISTRSFDYYLSGRSGMSIQNFYKFIHSVNLTLSDLAFFFDIEPSEEQIEATPILSFSDNPELEKKMQIIKQIYEDGDETLIDGIEMCLAGYIDKFLKKQQK